MIVVVEDCWRIMMEVKWSEEDLEIGEPAER